MQVLLSPAKKLADLPAAYDFGASQPLFQDHISRLVAVLKNTSAQQLQDLMGISDALAKLNFNRYQKFNPEQYQSDNAKMALFNFKGDVYKALDVGSLSDKALTFAQDHLSILSGLYGVLRPFDWMQDYRLEMGTRLQVGSIPNLYAFWQDTVTAYFQQYLNQNSQHALINLASQEYAKVVDFKSLGDRVWHIQFKEQKSSGLKTIGIMAKRARGLMTRFILEHQLESPEGLKAFDVDGYQYRSDLSQGHDWVFVSERG